MNNKKKTRYQNAKVYYKKLYFRMLKEEHEIITDYCHRNNVSKSYLMSLAVVYYIDCVNSENNSKIKTKRTNCKKSYIRITEFEDDKINQYCLKHHISKSRLIIWAVMYCIENNSLDEELSKLLCDD